MALFAPDPLTAGATDPAVIPSYADLGFDNQMRKPVAENPYQNDQYLSLLQFQSMFEGVDTSILAGGNISQSLGVGNQNNFSAANSFGGGVNINGDTGAISTGLNQSKITIDHQGIYAGSTTFAAATFSVDLKGNVIASSITLSGYVPSSVSSLAAITPNLGSITAGSLSIGSGNTIFRVDSSGNMWSGNASQGSAPFQVSNAGAIIATNVTITGGSLSIGSGNNIFKVDSAGNFWSGNSTMASAPFQVTTAGAVTANNFVSTSNNGNVIFDGTNNHIRLKMTSLFSTTGLLQIYEPTTTGTINLYATYDGTIYTGFLNAVGTGSAQNSAFVVSAAQVSLFGGNNSSGEIYISTAGGSAGSNHIAEHIGFLAAAHTDYNWSRDLYPSTDNTFELGNGTVRWKLIRGVTITSGDLAFEERNCHTCYRQFKKGEKLGLIVLDVEFDQTRTVPVHIKCPNLAERIWSKSQPVDITPSYL